MDVRTGRTIAHDTAHALATLGFVPGADVTVIDVDVHRISFWLLV